MTLLRYKLGWDAPVWVMGKIAAVLVKDNDWAALWDKTKGHVNPAKTVQRSQSVRVDPIKFAAVCQAQGLPVIYDKDTDSAYYEVDEETAFWEALKFVPATTKSKIIP